MATSAEAIYHRQASGLVREGKPTDGALFNVLGTTLGPVLGWILLFGLPLYKGASVLLATTIAFACCIGLNAVYALFASIMPRSGGDYVFISRTFSPMLGFTLNASFMFWLAFYIGTAGSYIGSLSLATVFRELGYWTGDYHLQTWGNWFNTHWGRMISGLALLVVLVYPVLLTGRRGLRRYFSFQRVVFWFCGVTLLATAAAMLFMSHGAFVSAFDHYVRAFSPKTAHPYAFILATGGPHGAFSFHQSLLSATWPYYVSSFLLMTAYWAGEHRTGLRSHVIGMVIPFAVSFVVIIVTLQLALSGFGADFLSALGNTEASKYGFESAPYFIELLGAWTGPLVGIVLAIGFGAWLWQYVPALTIVVTRSMLAWSFDGIMPEWLGRVDDRGNPVNATLLTTAIAIVLLALYSFTSFFSVITALLGFTITFFVACCAAIVFPYLRRDLFEGSQGAVRVFGIPLLSIAGVLGAAGLSVMAYVLLLDPNSGTSWANKPEEVWSMIVAIAVAALIYVVAWAAKRARGINLGAVRKELPIE
jgi:amino acid transporter